VVASEYTAEVITVDGQQRRVIKGWVGGKEVTISFPEGDFSANHASEGFGVAFRYSSAYDMHVFKPFEDLLGNGRGDLGVSVKAVESVMLHYYGTSSTDTSLAVVNIYKPLSELIQKVVATASVKVPDLMTPKRAWSLTPYVFTRFDSSLDGPGTIHTLLTRHTYINFERFTLSQTDFARRCKLTSEALQYAEDAAEFYSDRMHEIPSELQDALAHECRAWMKRGLKSMNVPADLDDKSMTDDRLLRMLVEFHGEGELTAKAAVAFGLQEEHIYEAAKVGEFNKQQWRLKPESLIDKVTEKAFEDSHPVTRDRANQPVFGPEPDTGMRIQPIFRLAAECILVSFDSTVTISSIPGLRPDQAYQMPFASLPRELRKSAFWQTVDMTSCDSTHFIATLYLFGLLLNMAIPRAKELVTLVMIIMSTLSCRWRAKTKKWFQTADFWAALMSGTPWTLFLNCVQMLLVLGGDKVNFLSLIVGGDDLVFSSLCIPRCGFKRAKYFLMEVRIEGTTQGYFMFHARIHCPLGSYPHIMKCAAKVINRRYPVGPTLERNIKIFQVSVAEQLTGFDDPVFREQAITINHEVTGIPYIYVDVCVRSMEEFTVAKTTDVMSLCCEQQLHWLETFYPVKHDGRLILV
jgi:hypothetical protein